MQITFLGTSCMVPTKERNVSGIFFTHKSEGVLVDCGEGTQRQMKIAGIPLTKTTRVLITHWHGDHVLGLPGLIQTLGAQDYSGTLEIYGPKNTKKYLKSLLEGIEFDFRIKVDVHEVEQGLVCKGKDFRIEALPMHHRISCLGYSFIEDDKRKIDMARVKKIGITNGPLIGDLQEGKSVVWKGVKVSPDDVSQVVKGKKVTFILDTMLNNNCFELSKNADVLVCESSYAKDLQDKAYEYKHLTAVDAGQIASKSGVKKLVLCHFSARYKDTVQIQEDAQMVFDNVVCASDFMRLIV